ncbi:MAG: hypothetical protein ACREML_11605, partial [Vulcanimicrobiaceae bacterium]
MVREFREEISHRDGIDDGAREVVFSQPSRFFEHGDLHVSESSATFVASLDELRKVNCACEARWPGTHEYGVHLQAIRSRRFTQND